MLLELFVLLAVVSILVFTQWAALSQTRERVYVTIDLTNMRQILRASALYNSDHNDEMAHPTWGSDLTGPDGWAYLTTTKNGPVPGALQNTPGSCTGYDVNSAKFTNQLAFFRAGQVTRYLPGVERAWCPKDVRHAVPEN